MKAVVYTEYGPPEVLHMTEVAKPTPKDHEVLVKVHATTVNFGDLMARNFKSYTPATFTMPSPLWLPTRLTFGLRKPRIQILGAEFSGIVEATGKGVTKFNVGDEIFAYRGPSFGGNAEYVCVSEKAMIAHKPSNLTFEEAATIPYGSITALNLLRKVNLQPGQKILVNGASGAIGSFAVQLAKHYGAEVTGVCGTPRMDFVKVIGADHVIDYSKQDFTKNGKTYDVIFDVMRKTSFSKCKNSLTANGIYLLVSFKIPQLWQMLRTSRGGGKRVLCALSMEQPDDLVTIKQLVEDGVIHSVIDRCYPLEKTAEAHRYVEDGHKRGYVVIQVA